MQKLNLDDTDLGGRYMKHQSFEGKNGRWLEKPMTIRDVRLEEIEQKNEAVVYFTDAEGESHPKGLVLNKTNYSRLRDAYGQYADKYIGKPVVLYTEATQRPDGQPTRGVRIRIPDSEDGFDPNLSKDDG